jgi:Stealth protein CR2, conserved region 2/Stealth protein CR1, conserved region 1
MTDIDAVVTWVNGADPAHQLKRDRYMALSGGADVLHENAVNPHRWACGDELQYCLRSMGNNAPWLRRIWIVTDAQVPQLSSLPPELRSKIAVVDHAQLFEGFADALPTFNSLAIESVLWRIEGLTEHFVYFNDDVFLTAALSPDDVFRAQRPVLRGKWTDYSALVSDLALRNDASQLHGYTQLHAAMMLGFQKDHVFASAHVIHPMRRSVFAQLWRDHTPAFTANIGHRFRDIGQFLPQSLHNHACINAGACVLQTTPDHLHVRTGAVLDYALTDVLAYLKRALQPEFKFLCINDLRELEAAIPDTRAWLERAIGS